MPSYIQIKKPPADISIQAAASSHHYPGPGDIQQKSSFLTRDPIQPLLKALGGLSYLIPLIVITSGWGPQCARGLQNHLQKDTVPTWKSLLPKKAKNKPRVGEMDTYIGQVIGTLIDQIMLVPRVFLSIVNQSIAKLWLHRLFEGQSYHRDYGWLEFSIEYYMNSRRTFPGSTEVWKKI